MTGPLIVVLLAAALGAALGLALCGASMKYLRRRKRKLRAAGERDRLMQPETTKVRYVTVEAARRGRAEIRLKGKIRLILLPGKLCRKLLRYAGKQKITAGQIFLTGSGNPLSRKQIWREMKSLCKKAHVEESKVFPHNLRHLFATLFYRACKNIVKLADVLGHSSVETTRIYLISTGREHARWMDRLGVIT